MRFERLDILRYGALTDRRLTFRPDARLHIVYGPNEAGKSSALSAISDLLFGFPDRSEYGFLHDSASLRVGARLVTRDGRELEFRRRKGRKNTLLSDSDTEGALPDDALVPFLGTLSRDVFERAFGLNSGTLRHGGDTMLKSGGEIGSLLFSAASGLTGLSGLRKSLEAEADGIYAQRKSKDRLFYQALDIHDEARRAERESELKASDWKGLLKEQAEAEEAVTAVRNEREATRRELESLRKLLQLEPVLAELDRERQRLASYDHLGELPTGFAAELAEALESSRLNSEARRVAEAETGRLKDDLAALHVDAALLAAAPRIIAAHTGLGVYLNAREDISRVRQEVDGFDQRLVQAAKRLGFSKLAELERAQPTDADLVRLRDIVDQGAALDRSLKQQRLRIEEEREALRRLDVDAGRVRLIDPKSWADQFAALRPDISALAEKEALKVRAARAESDLAAAASRLDPPVTDIARLLATPLPDIVTLNTHKGLIDAARAESRQRHQELSARLDDAQKVVCQLEALEAERGFVSRVDVEAARVGRDALFDLIAEEPTSERITVFRHASMEADRLSDAALADAERVSRHAELTLRRRDLDQAIAKLESEAKEAEIAAADALTEFEDLFHAAPVVPSAADKMIEWRRAVDDLAARQAVLNDAVDAVEALRLKEDVLVPALADLAEAIGVTIGSMPTGALARDIERRLEEASRIWTEGRSLQRLRSAAEEALARLEEKEADIVGDIQRWRGSFASAAALVGLPEDVTTEMALASLDVWRVVPDLLAERENRDRRVRGMTRDMDEFESAVHALCREVAPDLAKLPADVAAGMLNEKAAHAKTADSQRKVVAAAFERARLSYTRTVAETAAIDEQLAAIAGAVGRDTSGLSTMLEELRTRAEAEAGLRQSRIRFADQAAGSQEEDIRLALEGFDRVATSVRLEELAAADERQVEKLRTLGAVQANIERRRTELETGIGAEKAVFQKRAAEEEARELGRRWVVLKLASALLAGSMESYRERQADPVMKRAGVSSRN
ncbi:AAA family ATPase [Aliirhizobium terrae]|uniref:YhaN family protein n=1 Tax=Terrirhizobium terrae TaxID=2926709 RepID=UPI002577BEF3|nr:YhaN family protein [Rhizobium sp. CC-CFT758]WJH39641.1 AAA family ATPase [Rhizobium sp. CC-CFT758]